MRGIMVFFLELENNLCDMLRKVRFILDKLERVWKRCFCYNGKEFL